MEIGSVAVQSHQIVGYIGVTSSTSCARLPQAVSRNAMPRNQVIGIGSMMFAFGLQGHSRRQPRAQSRRQATENALRSFLLGKSPTASDKAAEPPTTAKPASSEAKAAPKSAQDKAAEPPTTAKPASSEAKAAPKSAQDKAAEPPTTAKPASSEAKAAPKSAQDKAAEPPTTAKPASSEAKAAPKSAAAKKHLKRALLSDAEDGAPQWSKLLETFARVDVDGNGCISKEELLSAAKSHGVNEEEIQEALKAVDKDSDGQINYAEFVKLMKS
eukprot:symbB.v1.2.017529.t1/scaffold1371.1/size209032/1